jgi:hypothetical protein
MGLSIAAALVLGMSASATAQDRLQSSDLLKLRSVSAVQLSPDVREAFSAASRPVMVTGRRS